MGRWTCVVVMLMVSGVRQVAAEPHALASSRASVEFVRETREFMREMARGNADDARRIAQAYNQRVRKAALPDRAALVSAVGAGAILPLPTGSAQAMVHARTTGAHPVGELDLGHQALYLGAHPAAIESLFRIAASVRPGPIEVTSLVRHREYQSSLARTNPNATTAGSLHTIGLAFDLSVLNVPPATARALGDVLLRMRASGDLFFIAETRQLVFHVVPAPSRLDDFTATATALASAGQPRLFGRPALQLAMPSQSPAAMLVEVARPEYAAMPGWPAGAALLVLGGLAPAGYALRQRRRPLARRPAEQSHGGRQARARTDTCRRPRRAGQ